MQLSEMFPVYTGLGPLFGGAVFVPTGELAEYPTSHTGIHVHRSGILVYMDTSITYRTGDYYGDTTTRHIWEITDTTGIAAELYVSIETGEITNIEVREDRRGEGLARALYETASRTVEVLHAPAGHRTPEGHAFAEAVGGDTIEYDCDCDACNPIEDEDN